MLPQQTREDMYKATNYNRKDDSFCAHCNEVSIRVRCTKKIKLILVEGNYELRLKQSIKLRKQAFIRC